MQPGRSGARPEDPDVIKAVRKNAKGAAACAPRPAAAPPADDGPVRQRRRPRLPAGRKPSAEAFARRHRVLQYVLAAHLPALTFLLIASDVGLLTGAAAIAPVALALALSALGKDGAHDAVPVATEAGEPETAGFKEAIPLGEQLRPRPATPAESSLAQTAPEPAPRAASIDVLPGSAAPVPLPRNEAPTPVAGLVGDH